MVARRAANASWRERGRVRRAMTLLELILVLALLVMIGAMAMPAFKTPFEYHRLRQGGELVRVEWNKARITAMQTGQTQVFRYAPESNTFQVMPYFSEQDVLEADAASSASLGLGMNGPLMAPASAAPATVERELPQGVLFVQGEVESDARSFAIQQQLQVNPIGMAMEATPVLFYPDGTTSDARVVLTNQYQQLFIVVSVRSLTGIVRVSDLLNADELQQQP